MNTIVFGMDRETLRKLTPVQIKVNLLSITENIKLYNRKHVHPLPVVAYEKHTIYTYMYAHLSVCLSIKSHLENY